MQANPNTMTRLNRGAWLRFAVEAVDRWIAVNGKPPAELRKIGSHARERRRAEGLSLNDLAANLHLPPEHIAMIEQGLVKPSEVPSGVWVRFMRLLDGREEAGQPFAEAEAGEQADAEAAPAHEETPMQPPQDPETSPEAAAYAPQNRQGYGLAVVKVVGVGGGGSNAVARMYHSPIPSVEYITVNTDAQHLLHIDVPLKMRIGDRLTRGLGVGGNPEMGREAAEESREALYEAIDGADMVFVACGMGGGTGTGAAPVIAEIAQETGALTIAVATKPFSFEGRKRMSQANGGADLLKDRVDTLILIPNDRLITLSDERMTAENAFRLADEVLRQGVQSIAELVTVPGEINLDFADIKAVMQGAGPAWIAIGSGRGPDRAVLAAQNALASPLLDAPLEGASRVLLNVTGGPDLTLQEVNQAADYISRSVDPEANIIFGMVTDPSLDEEVRITIIATGLPTAEKGLTLEDIAGQEEDLEEAPAPEPEVELPAFLQRFRRPNQPGG